MTRPEDTFTRRPVPGRGRHASLAVALNIAAAVLLALVAVVQIAQLRRHLVAEQRATARNLVHTLAGEIGRVAGTADLLLEQVVEEVSRNGLAPERLPTLHRTLVRLEADGVDLAAIWVLDGDGHLIAGTAPPAVDLAAMRLLRWHRDNPSSAVRVGMPFVGPVDGVPVVPFTRRLGDAHNQFAGVAVALVPLRVFSDMVSQLDLPSDTMFDLTRSDGRSLLRIPGAHGPPAMARPFAPDPRSFATALQEKVGPDRMLTTEPVVAGGLLVALEHPRNVALRSWKASMLEAYAILALMILLVVALGMQQLRQIRRLVKAEGDAVRAATELSRSEGKYRLLAENTTDIILRSDLHGVRNYVSPASIAVLGYQPDEMEGHLIGNHAHPDDIAVVRSRYATLASGRAGDTARITCRSFRRDGRMIWLELDMKLVRDPETGAPREVVATMRDISDRRRDEDRIARLSASDSLTGLANRRMFIERLTRSLAEAGPRDGLAVLFIDLDHFKPLNDLHGHAAGDQILNEVAARLLGEFPIDWVVARLGSDEFAVLVPECLDTGTAGRAAGRVLDLLAEPFLVGINRVDLGAHIGIGLAPRDASTAEGVLRAADSALHRAKRGEGRVCFHAPELEAALREEAEIKTRLRRALANGEIRPYYQPLVHMAEQGLYGFEVLARWENPERGLILPAAFVPIAEETGLIGPLFESLLRQVCADAAAWPQSVKVAVNISPVQLQDAGLAGRILAILADSGMAPGRLEVEVTENALVHDLATAKETLTMLRARGIRIALDDFGTGYSSVYHLKELRFDKIKVDRSFVRAVATDPESRRYVAVIVGLAHALDLEVTAEGIEDEATRLVLAELGCAYGQGYLFGLPVPAHEVRLAPAELDV